MPKAHSARAYVGARPIPPRKVERENVSFKRLYPGRLFPSGNSCPIKFLSGDNFPTDNSYIDHFWTDDFLRDDASSNNSRAIYLSRPKIAISP